MKGNVQILQFVFRALVVGCSALTTTDLGIRMCIRSELLLPRYVPEKLHHFTFYHNSHYFIDKAGILHVILIPYSPIVVG